MYRDPFDKKIAISAHFHDGYSLRNVIAFLRQTCTTVNMVFTPENIYIKEEDTSSTILVDCEIRMEDITDYKYDVHDEDGNLIPMIFCGFNTMDMQKATKGAGKKDGVKMFIREGDPNIYIELLHTSMETGNSMGLKFVPIMVREPIPFNTIPYESQHPNARPPIAQFSKFCSEIHSMKCTKVTVIAFENGILIQGYENKFVRSVQSFGTVPNSAKINKGNFHSANKPRLNIRFPEEKSRITIETLIIKTMAKFNNLCPTGVIKIYVEENKPLKIVSGIGCYGSITLYVKELTEE